MNYYKIFFLLIIIFMSNTLYALDESRLRFLIAVGPNPQQVNEFKEEQGNSKTDLKNDLNAGAGNFKIYYIFEFGLNIGYNITILHIIMV